MLIEDALSKFLTQLQADGRSHHTISQYQRHIRLFARWWADDGRCGEEVNAIGHEDVARFLAATVARTRPDGGVKKASSMNAFRSSLKGFFSYLHQAGYIPLDPGRLIRRAICGTPLPQALTEDEHGHGHPGNTRLVGGLPLNRILYVNPV